MPVAVGVPVTSGPPEAGARVWAREVRPLLWEFVRRDLTVRYRYALLGACWAVASPLAQAAIFAFLFTRVVRVETDLPYALYAFCGLATWQFTATALRGAVTSLSGNAALVSRVAFRREALPLSAVVVAGVDLGVVLPLVVALALWLGLGVPATALLVPALVLVHAIFVAGLALLLAATNLVWRDVRHLFEAGVTLWMFVSGVLYPVPPIGGAAGLALSANPMLLFVEGYRDLLLRGVVPPAGTVAGAVVAAALSLGVGLLVFRRLAPRFAEVA